MSFFGRFEINIHTATQEELDKIAEAIFNGYAEHILKERILWAEYYTPPAQPAQTVPSAVPHSQDTGISGQDEVSKKEPTAPLQRIDTQAAAPKVVAQEPKPERKTGILGRGRMGRTKQ